MSNWVKHTETNGTLEINNQQLFFPVDTGTVGQAMARWINEVPVADLSVSYDLIFFDDNNVFDSNLAWETRVRWDIVQDNYYAIRFNYFYDTISLHRIENGFDTTLIASVPYADWTPGQSYNVKILVRGNTIDVLVDDVAKISNAQDNDFIGTGYVGIGVRFFGAYTANNGPHWDNFAIEFLDDLGIQIGGGYAPMGISIPASGGALVSGIARISRRFTATGGVLVSGIARISRRFTATGGVTVAGEADTQREYKAFGGIVVNGWAKPGIHYKATGGITTSGNIPYVRKISGIGSSTQIFLTGESGGPYTTGILNFNWLTYTIGVAQVSGIANYQIKTRHYHYVASGGLTTGGHAEQGRKAIAEGGISVAGNYVYGSITTRQTPSGGISVDGTADYVFRPNGTGTVIVSGTAIAYARDRIAVGTGLILVRGTSVVKCTYFKYLPDLRIGITQNLNGNNIVPNPVVTSGLGILDAILNVQTNQLVFYLDYSLPTSNATGIKIYSGNNKQNGSLILDVGALFGIGTPIIGAITIPNSLKDAILLGNVYIVIESDDYPNGEIRAQYEPITPLIVSSANTYKVAIVKKSPWIYAGIGGLNVSGSALTSFLVKGYTYKGSKELELYNILDGNQVVPPSGSSYTGTVDLIIDKKLYDFYQAILTKTQVVPPTSSTATGYAIINYDIENRKLSWTIAHQGLSSGIISVTFNTATLGVNGPIVINVPQFSGDNTDSPIIGSCFIRQDQYLTMLNGTYITINTINFPTGEIRGQFVPQSTSLAATLTVDHNIPPANITSITLNCPTNINNVAPVAINITNYAASLTSPIVFQKTPINASLVKELRGNTGYIQINTLSKPDGEVRANLLVKNGGATVAGVSFTPGRVTASGYINVSGSAVIGIGIKAKGGIITGGSYGRKFTSTVGTTGGIVIGGSALDRSVIFGNGGINVSGEAIAPYKYRGFGGIVVSGLANYKYVVFGTSGIVVSGKALIRIPTRHYNPVDGVVVSGISVVRVTRKYRPTGGIVTSGIAVIRSLLNKILGLGGIEVSGTAGISKNHFKQNGSGGILIAGISKEYITRTYNVGIGVEVGGLADILHLEFPSSSSNPSMFAGTLQGIGGISFVPADDPFPTSVESVYCEFTQDKLEMNCNNGAFVPPFLRGRQQNYMPEKTSF